eukprot:IDg18844t1
MSTSQRIRVGLQLLSTHDLGRDLPSEPQPVPYRIERIHPPPPSSAQCTFSSHRATLHSSKSYTPSLCKVCNNALQDINSAIYFLI